MAGDWGASGQGALSGAGTGAGVGGAIGGPVGAAIGAGVGLVGGGLMGYLNRSKPSKSEKKKDKLVDQLLQSVNGQGPYSDLFNANEQTFQKNFAEPAMRRFKNVTAPQIQQQYIARGMHKGTGLEDALMRAGVNMEDMINQNYMQYQEAANQRKMQGLNTVLGQPNTPDAQSGWGAFGQGVGAYASTDQFGNQVKDLSKWADSKWNQPEAKPEVPVSRPLAKGFENNE